MSLFERKAQIVRVAMELFSKKGFRGTTTQEIAKAAGINQALIFRHFRRKKNLYEAILQEKIREPLEILVSEAVSRRDDRAVFSQIITRIIENNTPGATLARLLLFSALEGHALSRIFYERRVKSLLQFLSRYIHRRIREGAFARVHPRLAARALMGMAIHYVIVQEIFGAKRWEGFRLKEAVDNFVSVFLNGLRKR